MEGGCVVQRKHFCFPPSNHGFKSSLRLYIFSLLLSLWTVLRSSVKQWISQMQRAVKFRSKYHKRRFISYDPRSLGTHWSVLTCANRILGAPDSVHALDQRLADQLVSGLAGHRAEVGPSVIRRLSADGSESHLRRTAKLWNKDRERQSAPRMKS